MIMKVHVHLAYGFGEDRWGRRFDSGQLIGVNERDPYGYRHAAPMVEAMTSSVDHPEGRFGRLVRLGLRAVLGFDFLHAWRNRAAIRAADVVWTHTESQHLAISQVFALQRVAPADQPRLLAQSVWLMDRWARLSGLRRAYFRRLLRRADVLTFHSRENLALARTRLADRPSELVLFGINASEQTPPVRGRAGEPQLIIAVGNDVHRDWPTLIQAVARHPDWRLRIVSTKCPAALAEGIANVEIAGVGTNDDLKALYRQATIAIVPLLPNAHASGITVLQEAALNGVAAIASDVGGLRDYFADDSVTYYPSGDAGALERAIDRLLSDPEARYAQAVAAQRRMGPEGLSSYAFARRHVEISRALVARAPRTAGHGRPVSA
ncbi:glycosyltransferase involved in cell wall biosynthesis [Sphingomonas melonis]|uniref:Glycosyltransferase involved in cell wall biosynthesis n=2 Tax=Sphingomonas melonis TaxID=152682 RepID=A0A7Y9FR68_9SPHN|nr:glycosyltransferase involved in cell wall biosynthesis [Sphingomonas melonis]